MSKKYNEIMDQVRVTDEMKQRVLQNVKVSLEEAEHNAEKDASENENQKMTRKKQSLQSGKIIRSKFFAYGKTSRYLSAAACIMMLIVGGLTVPKLLKRTAPVQPGETMSGLALGESRDETMSGLALGESRDETMSGLTPGERQGEPMLGAAVPGDDTQESGNDEQQAMTANGMVEVDSLQELSEALGFEVPEVGNIPFEVENIVYVNGWNEFAQVTYQGEQGEALFRKEQGTEDISGDFNEYPDVKEIAVNTAAVTLKGENGTYSLAIWQQDGFSYSLSCEPGESGEVFAAMIRSIEKR